MTPSSNETLERIARRIPIPEPAYERMLRRRDRKRRSQRIAAGVVGIAVFVAAIWIVTSGLPFDRTRTTPVPGGSGTGPAVIGPSFDPSLDYVGLPPAGAEPSGPEEGELIARVHEIHVGWVYIYADGRIISWSEGGFESRPKPYGYREQRLTPEGIELLRSELISTGLLDRDRYLTGAGQLHGNGLRWGFIEVLDGERSVQVAWGDADPSEDAIRTSPTPEQAIALAGLVRPENPASSLPARAWEDATMRPYVPYRYAICTSLDGLPAASRDLLRGKERTFDVSGPDQGNAECFDVTTEDALALDEILADAGFYIGSQNPGEPGPGYASYQRWWGTSSADPLSPVLSATFEPILPHGTFASQPG